MRIYRRAHTALVLYLVAPPAFHAPLSYSFFDLGPLMARGTIRDVNDAGAIVGALGTSVNTPPPKGGGLGLRLEAGLIDPSADCTTDAQMSFEVRSSNPF